MIDRNHPAVKMLSALESETMRAERAECAVAGLPASDHPAVQRAARVLDAARSKSATTNAHLSILTALSHLTADDLRATPAGQALMAEAWSKFQEHYTAERGHLGHRAIGTWCVRRRIPAPTPPAEEVELPGEHPAHLLDARGWDDERFAYMALDAGGHWCGVDQEGVARAWPIRWIAAFTLPDGTRARRDGEHEDGTPRFVKAGEGEK